MADYADANRRNWDERAALHAGDTTGSYRIAEVLAGQSCLHSIEAREVGPLHGKDVAHLQCHIGLDTISLKHLGARSATGLDFSPVAIEAARDFARRAGADVSFVEASVYDAAAALGRTYDLVYVTWGAINWLPDIFAWAKVVASLLRPGGRLYLLEGHPQMNQLEARNGRLELEFDWRTPRERPLVFDDAQTYTGDNRRIASTRCYEWIHPLGDIVNAVVSAGLSLDFLNEHESLVWRAFPFVVPAGQNEFALPAGQPRIPLAFSLGATRR